MWRGILNLIPRETLIRFIAKTLTRLDDKAIDYIFERVEEVDKKYDLTPEQKRQEVYKDIKQKFNYIADWMINLIIELAVAKMKTNNKK